MKNDDASGNINVYLGEILTDIPVIFILSELVGRDGLKSRNLWNFFKADAGKPRFDFLKVVNNPDEADFFLVPHNYFILKNRLGKNSSYLSELVHLAKIHGKKILVLAMADSDEYIGIEESIIFRQSQYGYKKRANEIIMPFYTAPAYSDDFIHHREDIWRNISFRNNGATPVVSLCGWAGVPSIFRRFTYYANVAARDLEKFILGRKQADLHKRGIYFRRRAIAALKNSKSVDTSFIIRKSYSAQRGNDGRDSISPMAAEAQYVENIINSDFVLCPKGNGNGSIRFYEALSLGRFPVLISTDCVLPLADIIQYDKFVVNVDYKELNDLENRIIAFYRGLSDDEFQRRQILAREAFELLRPEAFFKTELWRCKSRFYDKKTS